MFNSQELSPRPQSVQARQNSLRIAPSQGRCLNRRCSSSDPSFLPLQPRAAIHGKACGASPKRQPLYRCCPVQVHLLRCNLAAHTNRLTLNLLAVVCQLGAAIAWRPAGIMIPAPHSGLPLRAKTTQWLGRAKLLAPGLVGAHRNPFWVYFR